jgi:DNA-binding response OmpR family regulator
LKHILVVDDDEKIRGLLLDYLSRYAFRVTAVATSQEVARVTSTDLIDLIVVDLNLGQEDGMEIVRNLATTSDVPIIIISGDRVDEADKVEGLELGAVDYVTKPFSMREFLARVRAGLRDRRRSVFEKDRRSYTFDDWKLSLRHRSLAAANGDQAKLTTGEFNLLVAFLKSPRQVLSREQLLFASRVHGDEVFDRSIDVLILRLRRKLEEDPSRPKLIKTERGIGYFLDAGVEVEDHACRHVV